MPTTAPDVPICLDERRKADVRLHPTLNGIDFVEYFEDRTDPDPLGWLYWLEVNFLKPAPAGLVGNPQLVRVEGGVRIVGVRVIEALIGSNANQLLVRFDQPGDFSTYVLRIDKRRARSRARRGALQLQGELSVGLRLPPDAVLPARRAARAAARLPGEGLRELPPPAARPHSHAQSALARAQSGRPRHRARRAVRLRRRSPQLHAGRGRDRGVSRHLPPSRLGEASCAPRRLRDARRPQRLDASCSSTSRPRERCRPERSCSRASPRALRNQPAAPGLLIPATVALDFDGDPALARVETFETTARVALRPGAQPSLPAHVRQSRLLPAEGRACRRTSTASAPRSGPTRRPFVRNSPRATICCSRKSPGPETGLAADADPLHRQVVRLIGVENADDPVYQETLVAGELQRVTPANEPRLPLQKVTWREEDALAFPLCLSTEQR